MNCNLTKKEIEILSLIADPDNGISRNIEIARELGIQEQVVKNYIHSILIKLDAQSRTGAVVEALKRGLLPKEINTAYCFERSPSLFKITHTCPNGDKSIFIVEQIVWGRWKAWQRRRLGVRLDYAA